MPSNGDAAGNAGTSQSTGIIDRIRCLVFGHNHFPKRAEDWEEGGYVRHHQDGSDEVLPACHIVEVCRRCGSERRTYAAVEHAEAFGIPKE